MQERERQRKFEEQQRKKQEEWQKRVREQERKQEEEEKKRLENLGRKFKCHCCGRPAREPAQKTYISESRNFEEVYRHEYSIDDWSRPGDLWQCLRCNHWFCKEHYHAGYCLNCWKKIGVIR
jgi:hypothetical protein